MGRREGNWNIFRKALGDGRKDIQKKVGGHRKVEKPKQFQGNLIGGNLVGAGILVKNSILHSI